VTGRWRRRGLLVEAPTPQSWAVSHAALPAVLRGTEGVHELFYSPRDARGRAHIARARLREVNDGLEVDGFDPEPVLAPGALGGFDDAGVTTSCLVDLGERLYVYYTGWSLGVSVPFYLHVGLAVSYDRARTFVRESEAPLLERDKVDPYLTASPSVLLDGGTWRMWYVSGAGWELEDGRPKHRYHVKYAESDDGVNWRRPGLVSIDFRDETEYAIARPCVLKEDGLYRMWFSSRGDAYRLGYAESTDGLAWERAEDAGLLPAGAPAWDSEMIAYPFVCSSANQRFLLYNGNGYGRTGIGYASFEAGA
jgi:hypothetical protein